MRIQKESRKNKAMIVHTLGETYISLQIQSSSKVFVIWDGSNVKRSDRLRGTYEGEKRRSGAGKTAERPSVNVE